VSAQTPYKDLESKTQIEKMVPYSEAKVFRTKNGFVIRDKEDEDWCKFVPFDDIDRLQTEIACKNLDPIVIQAMDAMPLPELTEVPSELIDELSNDIENIYKEESTIQIDALGSSADIPEIPTQPSSSILTREDLILHHFGSLAPYIDDYTRDSFETEEDHTMHLPRLSQAQPKLSSRSEPLSYQRTVLKQNPLTTEDFEIMPKSPKSNSLYCSGTSQQGSDSENEEDEDQEDVLSSLNPSAEEEELYRAEALKRLQKNPNQEKHQLEEDIELKDTIDELSDWELIKQSFPDNFIMNGLLTLLFLFILAIGAFAQFNIFIISTLCAPLNYFGIETLRGLKQFLITSSQNLLRKHGRRQQFTNQKGHTTRYVYDPKKPPFKQKKSSPKIHMNPLEGLTLTKPEGVAGSHKKTKKTYRIEPVKISEARVVQLTDNRHYFIVNFFDTVKRMALYDNGAACCTIHPRFLKELQQHGYVPIEDGSFNIEGFIPNKQKKSSQVAYLDFRLETGYLIKNIPFIVIESNYDILIGNNLVRAHRWANCWKNQDYYIDVGSNQPLVPTYCKQQDVAVSTSAVSIADVTVLPGTSRTIAFQLSDMGSRSLRMFKNHDLMVEPLFEIDKELEEEGLDVVPSLSRAIGRKVHAVVKNTTKEPMVIAKDQEIAKVTTIPKSQKIERLEELQRIKDTYEAIPRILTTECQCKQTNHLKDNETVVHILISDHLGNTSIGNFQDQQNPKPFKPGLKILYHEDPLKKAPDKKSATILLVADEEGSLGRIEPSQILEAKKKIGNYLKKHNLDPLYYFMDPLTKISLNSRIIITDLFKEIPFSFFPVQALPYHDLCTRPAIQLYSPQIFAGATKTRIHIQNGPAPPTEDLLQKERLTPVCRQPFKEGFVTMFRFGNILHFHLHLPPLNTQGEPMTEAHRNNIITQFFSELRLLRVPTNIEITTDGYNSITNTKVPVTYYKDQLKKIIQHLSPFLEPSKTTRWPTRFSEELPEPVDPTFPEACNCTLCTSSSSLPPSKFLLYTGDINDLINKIPSDQSSTTSSKCSRLYPQLRIIINSICEFQEIDDHETDEPLDIMNLVDEDEMQKFLTTYPGCEDDDEEDYQNLPPPQRSDPHLFTGHDMTGIPDQFRPGDWRKTDILDKIKHLPPDIQEGFIKLLDKHVNVFSYHATDCRPVLLHGKPAMADITLKHNEPIFQKPFPLNGKAVDMIDEKLTELFDTNVIVATESRYNMAIMLVNHNSSQKYTEEDQKKKVRMVIDVRTLNALTDNKNKYSYLVKSVEILLMELHGSIIYTSIDITKAYRAVMASPRLQEVTAFRVPSSKKYSHLTLTFRSACDGLAFMPGFYSYLMQEALSPEAKACTVAHIDDLLIHSKSLEDHLIHLDIVLTDLGRANFMVSAKKFMPFQKEVQFLGHMLDGQHKWIPEERRTYFDKLKPPQTKKQIQSFLGCANYLSIFIESFAMVTGPLYDAIKGKNDKAPLQLNDIQLKSFYEIKKRVAEAPKLHLLDTSKPIFMEVDASLVGTGSVLYQESTDENGKITRQILRYGSRRYSITESLNQTSLEREAMAILIGAKQHMQYLQACPEAIIKTDLKSLITILSCYTNSENTRMARMSFRIYSLPFKWRLYHSPGVDIPITDLLSRIHKPYVNSYTDRHLRYPDLKRDNIMMPPEWRNKPELTLTTQDLLKGMRDQIVYVEKSSNNVKEKRLKALINEVTIMYDELSETKDQFATLLEEDLLAVRAQIAKEKASKVDTINLEGIKQNNSFHNDKRPYTGPAGAISNWISDGQAALAKKKKKKKKIENPVELTPLTANSQRSLITPEFIIKHQNQNHKLHNIIITLRSTPQERIPAKTLKNFRLLNDSILVTRKNKTKPFDSPGNLRIVCDSQMTIHILSLIHVMSCHYGMNTLNHIFTNAYKCIDGSTQGFVKLVCTACRACRFHRVPNQRVVPEGRIPIPNVPNDTWMVDFMVFKQEQTFKGRKMTAAFNIMDLFSNLLISHPVKDQQHHTVIERFKSTFAKFNVPRKIVSDNAQAICRSPEVVKFLKNNHVKVIATTTAHQSQANKVERMHKIFRETLQLVQETFKRASQFDMYYTVIHMINSRPLTLALHPNVKEICKTMNTEPGVITPFSLHFGIPPAKHPMIPLENTLELEDRGAFRAKWQHIITEHDKMLQQELDERNEHLKRKIVEIGDLVLIKNMIAHKEQLKFYKEIYEVIKINKARYFCAPLFAKGRIMEVNGNNLKPYAYSEVFNQLPDNIRSLMGENLSPEELKKMSSENPEMTPLDLQNWRQWRPPTIMQLRNRITPADKQSEPALSIIETDILSSTSNSSDIMSIPDTLPDHASELSSVLTRAGVPQLKTTMNGMKNIDHLLPPVRKDRIPLLQRHKHKHQNIVDQAITLEDIRKSMQKRLQKQTKNDIMRQLSRYPSSHHTSIGSRTAVQGYNQTPSLENPCIHDQTTPNLSQPVEELQRKPPSSDINDYTTPRLHQTEHAPTSPLAPSQNIEALAQPEELIAPLPHEITQQSMEERNIIVNKNENIDKDVTTTHHNASYSKEDSYHLGGDNELNQMKPKMPWELAKTLTPESRIGFEITGMPDNIETDDLLEITPYYNTTINQEEAVSSQQDQTRTVINSENNTKTDTQLNMEIEDNITLPPEDTTNALDNTKQTPSKMKQLVESAKKLLRTPRATPKNTPRATPTTTPMKTPASKQAPTPKKTPTPAKNPTPTKPPQSNIVNRLRNRQNLRKPLRFQD
jgi:hypothetical protein